MLIVGKPGSGKTSTIRTMLTDEHYYYRKFDNVLLISPSANKMGIKVKKDNLTQVFDLKWIE
jgi:ABC-type multidrug transport system ATPase subunit